MSFFTTRPRKLSWLDWSWISLFVAATLLWVALFPLAEITSDDGDWILDAYLRWKDSRWLSMGPENWKLIAYPPLVSWVFALVLALSPTVKAIQLLVLGLQLLSLLFVRAIAYRLRLLSGGLLTAVLIVLAPPLLLNCSQKPSNVSWILFGSAFCMWAWVCHEGRRRIYWLVIALFVALQVHYSFVAWIFVAITTHYFPRRDIRTLRGLGIIAATLLLLGAFVREAFPYLRSLLDLLVIGSNFMPARSQLVDAVRSADFFLPWEIAPLFWALLARGKEEEWEWRLFFSFSVFLLALLYFWHPSAPHQWLMAWVLPALFLQEWGAQDWWQGKYRIVVLAWLVSILAQTAVQSALLARDIRVNGGVGWHFASLETKQNIFKYIGDHYPHHRIVLARPGAFLTGSLVGWIALATLPGEFGEKLLQEPLHEGATLVIEERGSFEMPSDFPEQAYARGFSLLFQAAETRLWLAPMALEGAWPVIHRLEHHPGSVLVPANK